METKKTNRANLEPNHRTRFFVGLIVSLSLTWLAFEYKSYNHNTTELDSGITLSTEDDIVIQTQRILTPPPPPPISSTIFIPVDDNIPTPDFYFNPETKPEDIIEDYPISNATEVEDDEAIPVVLLEEYPEFIGGESARIQYLKSNVKYPEIANEIGIQGTVHLEFVVEKDGKITHVKVIRGVSPEVDAEALRVVGNMPPWKPGKQRGREVRVVFNMPIKFVLQ
jgi:protein TonB